MKKKIISIIIVILLILVGVGIFLYRDFKITKKSEENSTLYKLEVYFHNTVLCNSYKI